MQADDTYMQVSAQNTFSRLWPSKMVNIPSVKIYVLLIYCFTILSAKTHVVFNV